jgi:deoxyadenosine/deoxycytidine kinase
VNSIETRELLIIINGTIGVGKTEISKCLASEIAGALSIEGDSLGFASPKNDHVLDAAIEFVSMHRKNGVRVLIFDMFFDDQEKLDGFIGHAGIDCFIFYLSACEDELSSRIRKRGRQRAESEILDSKRLLQSQVRMKNRGLEIDTNGKSTKEITAEIKNLILAKEASIVGTISNESDSF